MTRDGGDGKESRRTARRAVGGETARRAVGREMGKQHDKERGAVGRGSAGWRRRKDTREGGSEEGEPTGEGRDPGGRRWTREGAAFGVGRIPVVK